MADTSSTSGSASCSESAETYTCPWCHSESAGAATSCPNCGAPVDVRLRTTKSGWTEQPAIPDMAKIQFGQSSCQIEGAIVPVADVKLADGDSVFFAQHVLLWQDPATEISALPLAKAWSRHRAGLPLVMLQARGPGRIAFSDDNPGEVIAVPLQAGASVDVREHHLLAATGAVRYDWAESGVWFSSSGQSQSDGGGGLNLLKLGLDLAGGGGENLGGRNHGGGDVEWHYPVGQYIDRFSAGDAPGLVMIQVGGNAFVRDLAEGESILVKPPALLYKDSTVNMQLHIEYPSAGARFWRSWGNRYLWLRLWGPGRVAVQSGYERLEDPGTDFRDMSPATQQAW